MLIHLLKKVWNIGGRSADYLAPLANLAVRIELFNVFFNSGLLKVQSWDATLALFEYEYSVPLLSPMWAAVMGTGIPPHIRPLNNR